MNIRNIVGINKDYLVENYINKRLSINEIARVNNTTKSIIRRYMRDFDIPVRDSNSSYQYGFNETFFRSPNILNCYWAGFIAADGCIYDKVTCNKKLGIRLGIKDHNHLEIFRNDIKFTGPINIGVTQKKKKFCDLNIYSNIICDDLQRNFCITPRKSLTLQPPTLLSVKCSLAYIFGLIDGDGCITKIQKKYYNINLMSTYDVLLWVKFFLENNLELSYGCSINLRKRKKNSYYNLSICSQIDVSKVYNIVKTIGVPYLERKWGKLNSLKTS